MTLAFAVVLPAALAQEPQALPAGPEAPPAEAQPTAAPALTEPVLSPYQQAELDRALLQVVDADPPSRDLPDVTWQVQSRGGRSLTATDLAALLPDPERLAAFEDERDLARWTAGALGTGGALVVVGGVGIVAGATWWAEARYAEDQVVTTTATTTGTAELGITTEASLASLREDRVWTGVAVASAGLLALLATPLLPRGVLARQEHPALYWERSALELAIEEANADTWRRVVPPAAAPAEPGPTEPGPAEGAPADAPPADAVPADAVPADAVPADAVPADAVPADAVPEPAPEAPPARESAQ